MSAIDIDPILPNLYQGAEPPPGTTVRDEGFDALVLCAREIQGASRYPHVTVLKCPLTDDPDVGLSDAEWYRAVYTATRIATLIGDGARVLVTCHLGKNRSGLVSALTCHMAHGWSGEDCVKHVQACRAGSLFNRDFVRKLKARL